jgi:hypothetical protein
MQLGQEADQILQAAAEPVDRPRHDHVELALCCIPAESIEPRALVPALGAADTMILVDLADVPAHAAGDFGQLALLVGGRLLDGGNPKIQNGTLHWKPLRADQRGRPDLRVPQQSGDSLQRMWGSVSTASIPRVGLPMTGIIRRPRGGVSVTSFDDMG